MQEEIKKMVAEWQALNKRAFKKICGKLFEAYPVIQSFGWEYSQQWNDDGYVYYHPKGEMIRIVYQGFGETHEIELRTHDEEFAEWTIVLDGTPLNVASLDHLRMPIQHICEAVHSFIAAFTKEELAMFTGNDVMVNVSRETIEIAKYDPY